MRLVQNFHKVALFLAVEKENVEIVRLISTNDKLNVNILNKIQNKFYFKLYSKVE